MSIRNFLWEYPQAVMFLVRKFSTFFIVLAGILVGIFFAVLVSLIVNAKIAGRLFDGTLRYGVIGNLEVINPLEVGPSSAEQIASKLLYNSLVSIDETGQIYPELAETWAISPDGKEYTVYLKKNVKWHDGYELTSKDVATTFALLQSGDTQTVLGAIAKDVEVKIRSTYQISFVLKQVNAAFFELMATPVLPDHIYSNISYSRLVELGDSITPIGTGPYMFIKQDSQKLYLQANPTYFKGKPNIKSLQLVSFNTYKLAEVALFSGNIHALAPVDASTIQTLKKVGSVSPRLQISQIVQSNNTRLLLFNLQKDGNGKDIQFRQAVAKALNRNTISALNYGSRVAFGPYDQSSYVYDAAVESINAFSETDSNAALEKLGWTYPYSGAPYRMNKDSELSLSLTFLDTEVNRTVALNIREQLAKVGVNLSLNAVTRDEMLQTVLPQKEFELLLFEVHTGIDPDQYGLWHSSQKTFPGLNLSGYSSSLLDELLEKGRLQVNRDKRLEIYQQFQKELVSDAVAIFLYHPSYFEVSFDIIDRKLPSTAADPSDRFIHIQSWKMLPGWRNWQTR